MSLLVAETIVESTTYDALTNAIEAVVKTHTLIESKKVASEIQVVSTSTTTTTTDTKNNVTTEKETLTTNNFEKNNEKKKKQMKKTASIDNNDAPVITIRMLKKVEAELKIICEESRERFIPDGRSIPDECLFQMNV